MMAKESKYDAWLRSDGPAALVIREQLSPVEGPDGVLFPATYASGDAFPGGYNIDGEPEGDNVCLVDSVGSQANRIEPRFAQPGYADLVPQVEIVVSEERRVNLLEAGHRAADAIVRCSALQERLQAAFREVLRGNAEPLARIAPTSLVFGVWDSRDTQAKLPRLMASTIRAYNVRKLTRSAQYMPATNYIDGKLLDEPADRKTSDAYAQRGFNHVPATGTHGGVIADGGVRREATLSLAALRLLAVREGGVVHAEHTRTLRRYILGLALVALTAPQSSFLRQGCNLVPDLDQPREFKVVHGNGRREECSLTHAEALAYARVTAKAFGVGPSLTEPFDRKRAEKDIKGDETVEKIKGTVVSPDAGSQTFTLKQGGKKPDLPVTTTAATVYLKGKEPSTFEAVVVEKAKVDVHLSNGVAVKVIGS